LKMCFELFICRYADLLNTEQSKLKMLKKIT